MVSFHLLALHVVASLVCNDIRIDIRIEAAIAFKLASRTRESSNRFPIPCAY